MFIERVDFGMKNGHLCVADARPSGPCLGRRPAFRIHRTSSDSLVYQIYLGNSRYGVKCISLFKVRFGNRLTVMQPVHAQEFSRFVSQHLTSTNLTLSFSDSPNGSLSS